MRRFSVLFLLLSIATLGHTQGKELEHFRQEMTAFVQWDKQRTTQNADEVELRNSRLLNMEKAFLAFVNHKKSHSAEVLKEITKLNEKGIRCMEMRRDFNLASMENNANIQLSFHGVYDYGLSNFVSVYIQRFHAGNADYAVYYYKLNGKGRYFIKHLKWNKIVLEGDGFTSDAVLKNMYTIDNKHIVVVEDMGQNGQRAFVAILKMRNMERMMAFRGMGFAEGTQTFSKDTPMIYQEKRMYLHLAANDAIYNHYSSLRSCLISFDDEMHTISYSTSQEGKRIEVEWLNDMYEVNDFYLGQYMADTHPPFVD